MGGGPGLCHQPASQLALPACLRSHALLGSLPLPVAGVPAPCTDPDCFSCPHDPFCAQCMSPTTASCTVPRVPCGASNCASCSSAACTGCEGGFFLDFKAGACSPCNLPVCPAGCEACFDGESGCAGGRRCSAPCTLGCSACQERISGNFALWSCTECLGGLELVRVADPQWNVEHFECAGRDAGPCQEDGCVSCTNLKLPSGETVRSCKQCAAGYARLAYDR